MFHEHFSRLKHFYGNFKLQLSTVNYIVFILAIRVKLDPGSVNYFHSYKNTAKVFAWNNVIILVHNIKCQKYVKHLFTTVDHRCKLRKISKKNDLYSGSKKHIHFSDKLRIGTTTFNTWSLC